MKPIAKVLVAVSVLGVVLLGSAACFVACAVSHMHISGGSAHSGVEASRVETHEIAFDAGQPLRAKVGCGSIRVASTSGTSAQVVAHLRAYGSDKEEAEKRLASLTLDLGQNSVVGRAQGDHEIDLELTLPAGARLEIQSGSGDVEIHGAFGDTRAGSDYGDVRASGLRGALQLKSSSGDLEADEIQGGDVSVDTNYGNIALRTVKASRLYAHTSSGGIAVSGIEAPGVRLSSDYGDISVRELQGDLDSKTSSGSVSIVEAKGECRAHSDYGDVSAAGTFRGLALSSSSGAVHGRAASGSSLSEGWEIRSDYGDVQLDLPPGLSFELDATTDYGEVAADLPGVLGGAKGDETRKLHGSVGGGGPKLRLHSSSGDVSIRTR
jgi:DUF4097 and DUF4098 domain-containing protein YvlB